MAKGSIGLTLIPLDSSVGICGTLMGMLREGVRAMLHAAI